MRSFSELCKINSFMDRYEYLRLDGKVGIETFGGSRVLNQILYRSYEWKKIARQVVIRDNGYDLGCEDHPIMGPVYVHHMNPITIRQVTERDPIVFDPEYLISTSFNTHQAIHYSDKSLLMDDLIERSPFDTVPWRLPDGK